LPLGKLIQDQGVLALNQSDTQTLVISPVSVNIDVSGSSGFSFSRSRFRIFADGLETSYGRIEENLIEFYLKVREAYKNESLMWDTIESLKWEQHGKKISPLVVKVWLSQNLSEAVYKAVQMFVANRTSELYLKIQLTGHFFPDVFWSDDGVSDCVHHIVGLGREAFRLAMKDGHHLVNYYNTSMESFAYWIDSDFRFEKPETIDHIREFYNTNPGAMPWDYEA
jgi:hypothetical protein